jgi:hypothetical protein
MRVVMRVWASLAVAVALAGCGAADHESAATPVASLDPAVYGPKRAAPDVQIPVSRPHALPASPGVARALSAGVVGVVDWAGKVAVRPRSLETSADGTLEKLTWLRWSENGAVGRGELHASTCNPNCAVGPTKVIPATVTLSGMRACDGRRYFDAADVRIAEADSPFAGRQPVAYVRAPC